MIENKVNNNTDINKVVEETNVIVGDTKMQNLRTKTITVEVQVHKELKKAEVENLFEMDGVFFEVKRRTIYATKEINLPKEGSSFMMVLAAENAAEYEIECHVIDTMEEFYLEKCHAYVAEQEKKFLIEEAARIAKLKEEGLIDENGVDIEMDNPNIDDIVEVTKEETTQAGENTMLVNNANKEDTKEDFVEDTKTGETTMLNNGIFTYEKETNQSVYVDNNNYPFHTGYQIEQETEIYGNKFFNSVLKDVLEEYGMNCETAGNNLSFKNVLEEEEQEFEETPGYMVLEETAQKIAKIVEGFPVEELFQIKEDNETLFQGLINYHYES